VPPKCYNPGRLLLHVSCDQATCAPLHMPTLAAPNTTHGVSSLVPVASKVKRLHRCLPFYPLTYTTPACPPPQTHTCKHTHTQIYSSIIPSKFSPCSLAPVASAVGVWEVRTLTSLSTLQPLAVAPLPAAAVFQLEGVGMALERAGPSLRSWSGCSSSCCRRRLKCSRCVRVWSLGACKLTGRILCPWSFVRAE